MKGASDPRLSLLTLAVVAPQEDVDENAELDEENAEGKLRFSGGHGEAATYDDGDDEDKRIRAAAAKADDAMDDEVRPVIDLLSPSRGVSDSHL